MGWVTKALYSSSVHNLMYQFIMKTNKTRHLHIWGKMVLKIELINELLKKRLLVSIIYTLYQLYYSKLNLLICETKLLSISDQTYPIEFHLHNVDV